MLDAAKSPNYFKHRTRTISITSGKGGVGKTTLVCNMALNLAAQGNKVLILDGDLGMANVDIMFGLKTKYSIEQVLKGEISLKEVIVEVRENVFLIPGGSGVYSLQGMNAIEKRVLLDQVSQLESQYDYMLIDTAPGISDNVLYLNAAAQEILITLTPDPASLTDSYALVKLLNQKYKETKFSVVCNLVRNEHEALKVYQRLAEVTEKFLCVSLDYKGFVPLDQNLRRATKSQQLILDADPRSPSSSALRAITEKFSSFGYLGESKGGIQFFWDQLVGVA